MELSKIKLKNTFGMAKIANKTAIWNTVNSQMNKYVSAKEIMDKNLNFIKGVYPNKYLHTYESGDNVTFKISPIKNHFFAYITPAHVKYKDSYRKSTPIGIFTGFKLHLEKVIKNKV